MVMTVTKRKYRIILTLLVQSAIWLLSTCTPIKIHLNNYTDWLRHSTTPKPFVWSNYTVEPISWRNYTLPPVGYKYKYTLSSTSQTIWITYGVVFLISLLIFLLKNLYCSRMETNAPESSSQADSSPTTPPSENSYPSSQNTRIPRSIRNFNGPINGALSSPFIWENSRIPNMSTIGDKPPGYSEVTISDLNGKTSKFPEVFPKQPEMPPPKYDEGFLQRY